MRRPRWPTTWRAFLAVAILLLGTPILAGLAVAPYLPAGLAALVVAAAFGLGWELARHIPDDLGSWTAQMRRHDLESRAIERGWIRRDDTEPGGWVWQEEREAEDAGPVTDRP